MKKYSITIDKIPAFGFLIGRSEIGELIIMFPYRSIIIKKVNKLNKPVKI